MSKPSAEGARMSTKVGVDSSIPPPDGLKTLWLSELDRECLIDVQTDLMGSRKIN